MSVDPRSVILVDDEPHVLRSLKRTLLEDGYNIVTAAGGAEALELLEKQEVAMVISDYNMPAMNGAELLSLLKERYPDMIRIILTGLGDTEVVIDAINKGAIYKFMNKPWDNMDLRVAVKRAFEYRDLRIEHKVLTKKVSAQDKLLELLERRNPGITRVARDADGAIVLDENGSQEEELNKLLEDAAK